MMMMMAVTQVMLLGLEIPNLDWSQRLRLVGLASTTLIVSNLGILALKVVLMIMINEKDDKTHKVDDDDGFGRSR